MEIVDWLRWLLPVILGGIYILQIIYARRLDNRRRERVAVIELELSLLQDRSARREVEFAALRDFWESHREAAAPVPGWPSGDWFGSKTFTVISGADGGSYAIGTFEGGQIVFFRSESNGWRVVWELPLKQFTKLAELEVGIPEMDKRLYNSFLLS